MKRTLSILLALIGSLYLALPAAAAEVPAFSDVPETHWAYASIRQAAQAGAVNGTGAGLFSPEGTLTTAEFTAMLLRVLYEAEDLAQYAGAEGQWYAPYTTAAKALGLYEGTSVAEELSAFAARGGEDAAFLGEEMARGVSRYDMAAMLCGALGADRDETALASDLQWARESAPEAVADWDQVPEGYQAAVAFCFRRGLLGGMDEEGTFLGGATVTRAQAAAVLCRVLDRAGEEAPPAAPDPETPEEPGQEPEPEQTGPLMPNGQPMTEENVLAVIETFREEYPEGMKWTNDNSYVSHALRINGYGCAAFALMCSDAAFGSLPVSRKHSDFDSIRVGDMLRVQGNSHSVIVLEKRTDSVIIAEGNYAGTIHWDRELTREKLAADKQFYIETRYPQGA